MTLAITRIRQPVWLPSIACSTLFSVSVYSSLRPQNGGKQEVRSRTMQSLWLLRCLGRVVSRWGRVCGKVCGCHQRHGQRGWLCCRRGLLVSATATQHHTYSPNNRGRTRTSNSACIVIRFRRWDIRALPTGAPIITTAPFATLIVATEGIFVFSTLRITGCTTGNLGDTTTRSDCTAHLQEAALDTGDGTHRRGH